MLLKLSSVFFCFSPPLLLPNDIVHLCNLMMTPSSESKRFTLRTNLESKKPVGSYYHTMRNEGRITKVL